MATAIPPLKESEKIEFGYARSNGDDITNTVDTASTIVVASYNIRYAAGPFLISGGLLRKAGLKSSRGRSPS